MTKRGRRIMKLFRSSRGVFFVLIVSAACGTISIVSAQQPEPKKHAMPGPMLDQGIVNYETPDFTLSLVRSSQTVAALKPKGADGFDFTPGDLLTARSQNGFFHLGDITVRLRAEIGRAHL